MITILSDLVSLLSFRVRRVEDKSCRRWLRRDRYNGVAGAFAAIYFAVLPSVLRSRSLHFQSQASVSCFGFAVGTLTT
jgi:hypothetical protein